MMDGLGRAVLLVVMVSAVLGLSACREDEQGRPIVKLKGTYEGPADEKLTRSTVENLRLRAAGQKF